MRIKLAILEEDQVYLSRIVTVFNTKYSDKFEIYSFTDENIAMATLCSMRIDVLIVSDSFEIDVQKLSRGCGFAYFTDSPDVETVNDQRAICKFQKVDLIYRQILSIYSENAGIVSGMKLGDDSTKVIAFSSPSGGVGTSSVAAACAVYYAKARKRVLYLNLEKFGAADYFFESEGQFGMSDIIYALRSKKANLAIKFESCVKQDKSGVFFYSQAKIALDMLELKPDDIERLISEISLTGSYDYIIVDLDFSLSKEIINVYKKAHALVWVSDGSQTSNGKMISAFNALNVMEQNAESPLMRRLALVYNKFSNKTGKTLAEIGIRSIGGAPRYEHATCAQVIEQLSNMVMFEKII